MWPENRREVLKVVDDLLSLGMAEIRFKSNTRLLRYLSLRSNMKYETPVLLSLPSSENPLNEEH